MRVKIDCIYKFASTGGFLLAVLRLCSPLVSDCSLLANKCKVSISDAMRLAGLRLAKSFFAGARENPAEQALLVFSLASMQQLDFNY